MYRNGEGYFDKTMGDAIANASPIVFTIPVAPRTKKNHSQVVRSGGRTFVVPSKQYQQFRKDCMATIPAWARKKVNCAVNVKAIYYMPTARRVDKTNLESALMDVLVDAGVLADDSAISPRIVVSTDGSRVYTDKHYPRIEVEITYV